MWGSPLAGQPGYHVQRCLPIGGLTDDLHVVNELEVAAESAPYHRMVINKGNADASPIGFGRGHARPCAGGLPDGVASRGPDLGRGILAAIRVPRPRPVSTMTEPPSCSIR